LLVNNAGVIRDNPLTALDDEDVRIVLETNVVGTFNMARAVAPYLVSQRRGKIINISSVSGEKGGRGQTNYAASKGAINAFTRSLAVELAPRGITVNAVAPVSSKLKCRARCVSWQATRSNHGFCCGGSAGRRRWPMLSGFWRRATPIISRDKSFTWMADSRWSKDT
jgi:NAD(P)-dependent dehydrogenase (short-subunit alcohol dehydrogenase family)